MRFFNAFYAVSGDGVGVSVMKMNKTEINEKKKEMQVTANVTPEKKD